ncbi:MAG: hypothetical protein SPD11_01040 [Sphaerochaetaceae bacterium]|nr:hypothetical protein [Sphaerochaetaceae bacterium]
MDPYVSRLVTYYTPRGKESSIQRVVSLSIGEGPLPGLEDYPDPVVDIRSRPRKEGYELKGDLPLTVHVNLSQVRSQYCGMEPECFDEAMRWCYHLAMEAKAMTTDEEHRKICRIVDSDPAVREADRRYREALAGDDENLKLSLLLQWNAQMRYAGEMATSTVKAESAGLAKGMAKGLEKGKIEKAFETARMMKRQGPGADMIITCTGLSKDLLETL